MTGIIIFFASILMIYMCLIATFGLFGIARKIVKHGIKSVSKKVDGLFENND